MRRDGGEPRRTCVGCGRRDRQRGLLRLQAGADGVLRAVTRPLAGRSAYLHPSAACVTALAKSRLVKRSLRRDVDRERLTTLTSKLRTQLECALARSGQCS